MSLNYIYILVYSLLSFHDLYQQEHQSHSQIHFTPEKFIFSLIIHLC